VIWRAAFVALVLVFALIAQPFSAYLKNRPVEVKLGYLPHPQILKITSGEHKSTVAEMSVLRILFYFGTILQKLKDNVIVRPEFYNMYKTLQTAVYLDPYNMDAYYFAQASFTWELGRIKEVNDLLERGVKYRNWDPWLPFYLGFNYAYFQKDYKQGARYMKKAAELSGNPLFTNLAARYFYEAQQTNFGLAFLDSMIKSANSEAIRQVYILRRDALLAVVQLQKAVSDYKNRFGTLPDTLQDLVQPGLLKQLPADPYGGEFFLDKDHKVRSTSKFAKAKSVN